MNTYEERVREFAQQIWESEGRPIGQECRHWDMACKMAEGLNNADTDVIGSGQILSVISPEEPFNTDPVPEIDPTPPVQPDVPVDPSPHQPIQPTDPVQPGNPFQPIQPQATQQTTKTEKSVNIRNQNKRHKPAKGDRATKETA